MVWFSGRLTSKGPYCFPQTLMANKKYTKERMEGRKEGTEGGKKEPTKVLLIKSFLFIFLFLVVVLGMDPRSLSMLGSTTCVYPQPLIKS